MSKYSFDKKHTGKRYEVQVDTKAQYGYFEHHVRGEDSGGGLWFQGNELTDYDGVYELPHEVAQTLEKVFGFKVGDEFLTDRGWLERHGYFCGPRDPNVHIYAPGGYMVAPAVREPGAHFYAIVGDDLNALIKAARKHLEG